MKNRIPRKLKKRCKVAFNNTLKYRGQKNSKAFYYENIRG